MRQKEFEVEEKPRRRKEGGISLTKDIIKDTLGLGNGLESRSRVLVLVFVN
jgi:hypothetical protein